MVVVVVLTHCARTMCKRLTLNLRNDPTKQVLFCNISPCAARRRQSLNLNPGLSDAEPTWKVLMEPSAQPAASGRRE